MINGVPVCPNCEPIVQARRCADCNQPIVGRYVQSRGKYYHVDHFKCSKCGEVLRGKNFVLHHNKYFCPKDGAVIVNRCAYCKNELDIADNDNVIFNKKNYHKRCFVCRVCGMRVDPDNAKSFHGRPHCNECYAEREKEEKTEGPKKHSPSASNERREKFKEILFKEEENGSGSNKYRFKPPQYRHDVGGDKKKKKDSSSSDDDSSDDTSSSSSSSSEKKKKKNSKKLKEIKKEDKKKKSDSDSDSD